MSASKIIYMLGKRGTRCTAAKRTVRYKFLSECQSLVRHCLAALDWIVRDTTTVSQEYIKICAFCTGLFC